MKDLIALVADVKRRRESQRSRTQRDTPTKTTTNQGSEGAWPTLSSEVTPMPYLTERGDLVIPFDSPSRYHWWNSGQSIAETLAELEEKFKAE